MRMMNQKGKGDLGNYRGYPQVQKYRYLGL